MEPEMELGLIRDFAIIMAVAGLVVVLFHKIKQPPILGYILAGLLVGPFTLPKLTLTNQDNIRLLADLGLVLLLFALGLEFGWRRIRQVGLSVLLIAAGEMLLMISLGYAVGRLLGWSHQESIFLGAALSITSSAILIKVLRDMKRLSTQAGRLIVGISVVEDFVAVVLLAILSGMATTGTATLGDIGLLLLKLGIFGAASLVLGAVFVPRIMKVVCQFGSRETILLASLALCFLLALVGQTLGLSAAAGAFLIGAVIGDTEESSHITEIIEPIRDMFGALFFVSIGMLINVRVIVDFLIPTLLISAVFIVGKILGNTAGSFVTGQPERVPIRVGTGMPQIGEFSLAMVKVGVEHQAIGAFMYQVIAGVTAVTSLIYPYIARSPDRIADLFQHISPKFLQRSASSASLALQGFSGGNIYGGETDQILLPQARRSEGLPNSRSFDREKALQIRRLTIPIGINLAIIVVLLASGAFAARFGNELSLVLGISTGILGNIIGIATLLLCVPSVVALWRGLRHLSDAATSRLLLRRGGIQGIGHERLRNVARDVASAAVILLIGIWSLPLVLELLSLNSLAAPLPLVVIAALIFIAIRSLTHMHGQLVSAVSRTFLGEGGAPSLAPPDGKEPIYTETPSSGIIVNQKMLPGLVTSGAPRRLRSPEDAKVIALEAVAQDQSAYHGRMAGKDISWTIKEVVEAEGYYRVTLYFRETDADGGAPGEEELYLDPQGDVRLREIRKWPSKRRFWART